jgi:hypothetical protein
MIAARRPHYFFRAFGTLTVLLWAGVAPAQTVPSQCVAVDRGYATRFSFVDSTGKAFFPEFAAPARCEAARAQLASATGPFVSAAAGWTWIGGACP